MSKERELLKQVVENYAYVQDMHLIVAIQKLLNQPEQRLTPLTSKLISLGNNCHESFIKGVKFAEAMHGIGGGE